MQRGFAALLLFVAAAVTRQVDDAWNEGSDLHSASAHTTSLAESPSARGSVNPSVSYPHPTPKRAEDSAREASVQLETLVDASAGGGSEAFVVFKLPEHGDLKLWLLAVICAGIIVFTLLFETVNHYIHHALEHKRGWRQIFEKVQDELMLLGLISFVFFFVTQALTNEDEITIEHFELGHYLLFAIGLSYSLHNLVIYYSMAPHFQRWAKNEAAVRHPTAQFAALETDGGRNNQGLLKVAEWTCVRSAYLDRNKLPARFDYGEYLHMVSIDYLLEIAEADWVAWGATFVLFCILGSIIFVIEHVSQVDFSDTHGMIQVATYVMIGLGWLLALCYWLCSYFLNQAKKFALQNIGCEDTRKLLVQLSLVLNDDGSKTRREDGTEVSKVWPRGWSTEGAFDNRATDSATLLDKGIDLSYETFFTRNVLRLLASFMLCSNVYFAMMVCIFGRAVYSAFDNTVLVVVYIALAAPYFLIIFYLSPRAVASFVLIHAFKEKSDEVALELQEDLEYAERMGERVKKGIESSGKPYEAVERVFDALDYNKDGNVDHREFSSFMRQLDVQISKRQLSKLIAIVDPTGKGRVAKAALMYWLFPEEHLRLSMSVGQKIGMTLSQGSFTKLEGSQ